MPAPVHWLMRIGFQVSHVPGVSRAFHREFEDGSFIVITDLGGFDLPEPCGPFEALWLSARYDPLEHIDSFASSRELARWIRHVERGRLHSQKQRSPHSLLSGREGR